MDQTLQELKNALGSNMLNELLEGILIITTNKSDEELEWLLAFISTMADEKVENMIFDYSNGL